jgi:hypothetical protein
VVDHVRVDGVKALSGARWGSPQGSGRRLTDDQAAHVRRLIDRHTPDQLGVPRALWDRGAVQLLIRLECQV